MSKKPEMMNFNVWRYGANYIPACAVNQLEMWQEESFAPETIRTELSWAQKIGMKVMRVYLHDLAFLADPEVFLRRVEAYLAIADSCGIKSMLVFFDDCWNEGGQIGKQPEPKAYTHNSGWLQSPGASIVADQAQWGRLGDYMQAVLTHFRDDERIFLWDLYNEPGNGTDGDHVNRGRLRGEKSLPFLKQVFRWAQEIQVAQPCTVGAWNFEAEFHTINQVIFDQSEVVSFHCYAPEDILIGRIRSMEKIAAGRPVVCSEYMARPLGSTFAGAMPLFFEHNITAFNWGLVAGKTNTIYQWGWSADKGEPDCPFHDVFHADGTLLIPDEAGVFERAKQWTVFRGRGAT